MADIKTIDGFHVATFTEVKELDIDVTRERFDTKIFNDEDERVGFFRETIVTDFDGETTTHHAMIQPHPLFEKLGMEGRDFAF